MKVSDLVKFHSTSWVFDVSRDYANPGIILAKIAEKKYRVLWSDQRFTTEHECYLKHVEEEDGD